ncbi:hypothetical protein PHISCL_00798 [Aspergillus sclerotialis]|uniref:Uncharacterized protein n=1 Tax=Aspergillus sclerotialis TaxID=2070753 RepID=A0A3A2ZUZ6_9EURO|nr:hypothetical protein PHISCL_00798 [Aspergillus sclerotialis]
MPKAMMCKAEHLLWSVFDDEQKDDGSDGKEAEAVADINARLQDQFKTMFFYARRKVYNTVGATIGLTSEAVKAKKAHQTERNQNQDADIDGDREDERDSGVVDEVHHAHERQWDLDEARDQLLGATQLPEADEPVDNAHLAE